MKLAHQQLKMGSLEKSNWVDWQSEKGNNNYWIIDKSTADIRTYSYNNKKWEIINSEKSKIPFPAISTG